MSDGFEDRTKGRAEALWQRLAENDPSAPGGGVSPGADTTRPMTGNVVRGIVVYLGGLLLIFGMTTWSLWSARPPQPASALWTSSAPPTTPPVGPPVIDSIRPDTVAYGVGQPLVRIAGSGFDEGSELFVDGVRHPGGRFVAHDQMVLELRDADFRQSGSRAVTVTRDTAGTSGAASFHVETSSTVTVGWRLPVLGVRRIGVEGRLLLLVLFTGGLGGTLAALYSLSNYRGEGRLFRSWFLYYVLSPWLGAGIALFLYLVVRAGFLSGTNLQIEADATPWGLLAVSGLAGLFYDKALIKLREVFMTLFNPRDDRSGKLKTEEGRAAAAAAGIGIGTESLKPATTAITYRTRLEASGGKPAYSWSVKPPLPGGLRLDPLTGVLSGTPTEASPAMVYRFTVSDMDRASAAVDLEFEVR